MKQIKIQDIALNQAITRLNNLATSWASDNLNPPAAVGGGKVANEMENLVQIYKDLNSSMVELATITASFLGSVRDSFKESDQQAYMEITRGGS